MSADERTILDAADVARAVTRMAAEILEANQGADDLVLLGIPTRGVPLSARLAEALAAQGATVPVGELDITMYRDDLLSRHTLTPIGRTRIPGSITDQVVVLVDDVLYSGRTVAAALDALNDLGRPRAVRLAVLVDRGHRELPIRADFVGRALDTRSSERVRVRLEESDGMTHVTIGAAR